MPDHFDLPNARQKPRIDWLGITDLAELERRAERLRAERDAAEARIIAADTGLPADSPAYDAATEEFDLVDDELVLLDRRIEELEEDAGWDAVREQRRAYWAAVL